MPNMAAMLKYPEVDPLHRLFEIVDPLMRVPYYHHIRMTATLFSERDPRDRNEWVDHANVSMVAEDEQGNELPWQFSPICVHPAMVDAWKQLIADQFRSPLANIHLQVHPRLILIIEPNPDLPLRMEIYLTNFSLHDITAAIRDHSAAHKILFNSHPVTVTAYLYIQKAMTQPDVEATPGNLPTAEQFEKLMRQQGTSMTPGSNWDFGKVVPTHPGPAPAHTGGNMPTATDDFPSQPMAGVPQPPLDDDVFMGPTKAEPKFNFSDRDRVNVMSHEGGTGNLMGDILGAVANTADPHSTPDLVDPNILDRPTDEAINLKHEREQHLMDLGMGDMQAIIKQRVEADKAASAKEAAEHTAVQLTPPVEHVLDDTPIPPPVGFEESTAEYAQVEEETPEQQIPNPTIEAAMQALGADASAATDLVLDIPADHTQVREEVQESRVTVMPADRPEVSMDDQPVEQAEPPVIGVDSSAEEKE